MHENFNQSATNVVTVAREATRRYRHGSIGPEHILLGLVSEQSGAASKILKATGLKAESVQAEIEKSAPPATAATAGDPPLSPTVLEIMQLAGQEATRLGSNVIGSDHILLGLLKHGNNRAIEILHSKGMDARRLGSQVEQMSLYAPKTQAPAGKQTLSIYTAFSDRAVELTNAAKELCTRAGGHLVGSEHYLMAIIANANFLAGNPLRAKGFDVGKVSALVAMLPGAPAAGATNPEGVSVDRFELTRVLQQAFCDAIAEQEMVGTCHIMLAILKQPSARAAQVLGGMGVDVAALASELNQLLHAKREELANLGRTLGATVKTMVPDGSEGIKSLPVKMKLDIEELLAGIEYEQGNVNAAATRFQQLILFRGGDRSVVGEERMRNLLNQLALAYIKQARYGDAQAALERAVKMSPPSSQTPDMVLSSILTNIGWLLILQGRTQEAKPYLERAMSIVGNSTDLQSRLLQAQIQNHFGECLRADGDFNGASSLLQAAFNAQTRLLDPEDPQLAFSYINQGKLLMGLNRVPESGECFGKALSLQEVSLHHNHPDIAYTLTDYAPVLEAMKRHDLATHVRERIDSIRKHSEVAIKN